MPLAGVSPGPPAGPENKQAGGDGRANEPKARTLRTHGGRKRFPGQPSVAGGRVRHACPVLLPPLRGLRGGTSRRECAVLVLWRGHQPAALGVLAFALCSPLAGRTPPGPSGLRSAGLLRSARPRYLPALMPRGGMTSTALRVRSSSAGPDQFRPAGSCTPEKSPGAKTGKHAASTWQWSQMAGCWPTSTDSPRLQQRGAEDFAGIHRAGSWCTTRHGCSVT